MAELFEQGISAFTANIAPANHAYELNTALKEGIANGKDIKKIINDKRKYTDIDRLEALISIIDVSNLIAIADIDNHHIKNAIKRDIVNINTDTFKTENEFNDFANLIKKVDKNLIKEVNINWPNHIKYDIIKTFGYIKTPVLEIDTNKDFTNELAQVIYNLYEIGFITKLDYKVSNDIRDLACLFNPNNFNSIDLVQIIDVIIKERCQKYTFDSGNVWVKIIKCIDLADEDSVKTIVANVKRINSYFAESCELMKAKIEKANRFD